MKTIWKRMLCATLILCCLASACLVGATGGSTEVSMAPTTSQGDISISPMASILALDANIADNPPGWIMLSDYVAYRIWIDNTTGALMTVTITNPSGRTNNVYITSGSNKTYTNNDAEPGVYRLSFHTYADSLSGTVRVRVSTVPL